MLPPELLERVFLFLLEECNAVWFAATVPNVCQSWRSLTRNSLVLRRSTVLSADWRTASDDAIQDTLRTFDRSTVVNLNFRPGISPELVQFLSRLPNLSGLNLNGCSLHMKWRGSFGTLKSLNLEGSNIRNSDLRSIAKGCPQLREINVSDCRKISSEGLSYFRNLTCLDVSGCIFTCLTSVITAIAKNNSTLLQLRAAECTLNSEHLRTLCSSLPHLLVIDVSNCWNLNERGLVSLGLCTALVEINVEGVALLADTTLDALCRCPNLRKLQATCSSALTKPACDRFFRACPQLKQLILTELDDRGCSTLIDSARDVVSLQIWGCSSVYDLQSLNCANITTLRLDFLENLDKESLRMVATGLPRLVCLSLIGCSRIAAWNPQITALLVYTSKYLASLELCACNGQFSRNGVTDECLYYLAKLQRLKHLKLDYNRDFTADGLHYFLERARLLDTLEVAHCTGVTDMIGRAARKCKSLNVAGTTIGPRFFDLLLRTTRHSPLVELNCSGTGVDGATLKNIKNNCPRLEHLYCDRISGCNSQLTKSIMESAPAIIHLSC